MKHRSWKLQILFSELEKMRTNKRKDSRKMLKPFRLIVFGICSHLEFLKVALRTCEWKFIDPLNSSVAFAIKNSSEEAVGAQGEVLSFFLSNLFIASRTVLFTK